MIIKNIDDIFALSIGACIICLGFMMSVLIKAFNKIDFETKCLYLMQSIICFAYLVLEYRLINQFINGSLLIVERENLYWIIFEAIYFAVSTLLMLKIYKLQIK